MFFAKRRWALRVVERMGIPTKSVVTTELVGMIIQGAKQYGEMVKSVGQKIGDPELVLMSALAIDGNNRYRAFK